MIGNIVFLAGIHGSGKGHYSNYLKKQFGIRTFSASGLIREEKNRPVDDGKIVLDASENQDFLVRSIESLNESSSKTLIDGHFVLDMGSEYFEVPITTFEGINVEKVLLRIEKPSVIRNRLLERDGHSLTLGRIEEFQERESARAEIVTQHLKIPLIRIENSKYTEYDYIFLDDKSGDRF